MCHSFVRNFESGDFYVNFFSCPLACRIFMSCQLSTVFQRYIDVTPVLQQLKDNLDYCLLSLILMFYAKILLFEIEEQSH